MSLSQGGSLLRPPGSSLFATSGPRKRDRPNILIQNLTVDQVMTSPPTIGAAATSSAISNGKNWLPLKSGVNTGDSTAVDPNAPFDYGLASAARQQGTSFPSYNYLVCDSPSHPNAQSANYRARFWFDGTNLEIMLSIYANTTWQIYVNGQAVSSTAYSLGSNQTVSYVPVTFSTRAARLIEVVSSNPWGGVRTQPTDTIWKPPPVGGPRCIVLGDSYTGGTGADAPGITGWVQEFAQIMGWPDTWAAGVGGSGYLNAGTGTTFGARVPADIVANKPDIVLVVGGHNDTTYTTSALQAAASTLFQSIKGGLPNVKLVVVAPLGAQASQSSYAAMETAMFTAANGVADLTVDTLTPSWFGGLGYTGTNRTVTDGVTTNASTTITSATAAFVSGDVGRIITGAGIPAYTTISSVTNSTTAVLSTAATASATGVTLNLTNQRNDGNDDYYIWTDNVHPSQAGHKYLAQRIAAAVTGWLSA